MTATQKLMELDPTKSVVPFGDGTNTQFHHSDMDGFNQPTGISCEECDFLYGLVRIIRPRVALETGTNIGISASAIGLAMKDNGFGKLHTIEHDSTVAEIARRKLATMGLSERVEVICAEISAVEIKDTFDFLWLDSELRLRFSELVRFFPQMNPGAIACIHDLYNMEWKEFGEIPDELTQLLKTGELRSINFHTTHGVSVYQRRREKDYASDILK